MGRAADQALQQLAGRGGGPAAGRQRKTSAGAGRGGGGSGAPGGSSLAAGVGLPRDGRIHGPGPEAAAARMGSPSAAARPAVAPPAPAQRSTAPAQPSAPQVEEARVDDKDAHGVRVARPPHARVVRHVVVAVLSGWGGRVGMASGRAGAEAELGDICPGCRPRPCCRSKTAWQGRPPCSAPSLPAPRAPPRGAAHRRWRGPSRRSCPPRRCRAPGAQTGSG